MLYNKRYKLVPIELFSEQDPSESINQAKDRLFELLEKKNISDPERMALYEDLLSKVKVAETHNVAVDVPKPVVTLPSPVPEVQKKVQRVSIKKETIQGVSIKKEPKTVIKVFKWKL